MLGNLALGCTMMAINLMVQCLVVSVLFHLILLIEARKQIPPTVIMSSLVLVCVMAIMMIGNLLQMAMWAYMFFIRGAFSDYATAFYHSVVNFTTLGYGDIVMPKALRLLGALEAANGVMMFGLTTGVVFMVLSGLIQRGWIMSGGPRQGTIIIP